MIITHDTTIEEYEAWLSTNPPLLQLKRASIKAFKMVFASIKAIKNLIKKIKKNHRSCLAGKRVNAFQSGDISNEVKAWREYIINERIRTTMHIKRISLYEVLGDKAWGVGLYRTKHALLLEQVEAEITKEMAKASQLEKLKTTK
jgi:hypothetical protein